MSALGENIRNYLEDRDVYVTQHEELAVKAKKRKAGIMEILRRHPKWDEERMAVYIDFDETRDPDYIKASSCIDDMAWFLLDMDAKKLFNILFNRVRYNNVDTINDEIKTEAGELLSKLKVRKGQKIAKVVRKLCDEAFEEKKQVVSEMEAKLNEGVFEHGSELEQKFHTVVDRHGLYFTTTHYNYLVKPNMTEEETKDAIRSLIGNTTYIKMGINGAKAEYEKVYAKFSDFMKPAVLKRRLFLSVNPLDFLAMSRGNSWRSCHELDGEYRAGTLSYALDEVSMILFTVDSDNINTPGCHKINRQIYCYNDHQLLQSRLYPNYENTDLSKKFRNIVEEIMAECLGEQNKWMVRGSNFNVDTVSKLHYPDYDYGHYNCKFATLKSYMDRNLDPIEIGSEGMCLSCGDELEDSESLYCASCDGNEQYCEYCGCYENESNMSEIYYNGELVWVCTEHIDNDSIVRCEHCDYWVNADQTYTTEDNYTLCEYCLGEHTETCEECNCTYHDTDYCYYREDLGRVLCDDCYEEALREIEEESENE